ncbi:hypothetical protein [Paraglaciecola sp.]|uniref:hypothetical protein n=1 Tax=Paraglaciecola sp. TaxID=1920173 RepID=UPI003EF66D99
MKGDFSYKFIFSLVLLTLCFLFNVQTYAHSEHDYQYQQNWLTPPKGLEFIGNSHGGIAVDASGEIYVSVMGEKGGIQVYNAKGDYQRNVSNAPDDIHGFVIKSDDSGQEFIYGAEMNGKRIFKLTLDGKRVLDIDALKVIPNQYHKPQVKNNKGWIPAPIRLTSVDIDTQGNLYVVDGYGLDYIHKFSAKGDYLETFGGQNSPWNFRNCHKIYIDPRYQPNRLLCNDRANHRLVHLKLNGELIGTYAKDLKRPSAADFYHDYVAIAEISGRVTILDKAGKVLKHIGTNEDKTETDKNKTPPEKWRNGVFTSPHGISFDASGNLYITEYNKWGRVLRFDAVLDH